MLSGIIQRVRAREANCPTYCYWALALSLLNSTKTQCLNIPTKPQSYRFSVCKKSVIGFKGNRIRPWNCMNFALKEYIEKWTDPAPEPRKLIQASSALKQDYFHEEFLQDQTPNCLWITQYNFKARHPLARFSRLEKAHLSFIWNKCCRWGYLGIKSHFTKPWATCATM